MSRYEPDVWNDRGSVQGSHNCYAYFLDDINPDLVEACDKRQAEDSWVSCYKDNPQPGAYANVRREAWKDNATEQYTCPHVVCRVLHDSKDIYRASSDAVQAAKDCSTRRVFTEQNIGQKHEFVADGRAKTEEGVVLDIPEVKEGGQCEIMDTNDRETFTCGSARLTNPTTHYVGAILTDPGKSFHFLRRDADQGGVWSHKNAAGEVSQKDVGGHTIEDEANPPDRADLDYSQTNPDNGKTYSSFCGYFCVPKNETSMTCGTRRYTDGTVKYPTACGAGEADVKTC